MLSFFASPSPDGKYNIPYCDSNNKVGFNFSKEYY